MASSLDSRAARIKTYVAALFEQLPAPGENGGFTSATFTRSRKLSTLARGCGIQRRSTLNCCATLSRN